MNLRGRSYDGIRFKSNCLNHDYGHHNETCPTFGKTGAYPTHEAGATYTGPRGPIGGVYGIS